MLQLASLFKLCDLIPNPHPATSPLQLTRGEYLLSTSHSKNINVLCGKFQKNLFRLIFFHLHGTQVWFLVFISFWGSEAAALYQNRANPSLPCIKVSSPLLTYLLTLKPLLLCRLSACRRVPTLIAEVDRQALNPSNFHTRKAELSESFNSKRNKIAFLSDGSSQG